MIDFDDLVARKGIGPKPGQTQSPHSAWSYKTAVSRSEDLRRILALPRRAQELDGTDRAEAIIDVMTERFARNNTRCKCSVLQPERHREEGCITRLRLVQALALREIGIAGGLLGPVGTGFGKSLIDLLAPLALTSVGVKLSVLLIPPRLVPQLIGDYEYVGQHFKMPQIVFHGNAYTNTVQRMNNTVLLEKGAPVVHVVPYSRLMRPEATAWLETALKPEAIIADECFVGETLIDTDEGSLTIKDVVENNRAKRVLSYDTHLQQHVWKNITKRIRNPGTERLVRVNHDYGSFTCTETHKIWTVAEGYVRAKDLTVGQLLVRTPVPSLPGTILVSKQRISSSEILFDTLCKHQRKQISQDTKSRNLRIPAQQAERDTRNNIRDAFVRPGMFEMPESFHHQVEVEGYSQILFEKLWGKSCSERQEISQALGCETVETNRSSSGDTRAARNLGSGFAWEDLSRTWREWSTDKASTSFTEESWSTGGSDGARDTDKSSSWTFSESAGQLQSRHRFPRISTSDRGRRSITQNQEMEVSGSSKDRDPKFSRVVSVEVLERGSVRADRSCGVGDFVYDLTVEDTHNYFANGVLVSNCHKLRDFRKSSTGKRVKRYMDDHPETFFCGWSGSITAKSLRDYAHLAAWALKHKSPLPNDEHVTDDWARALDPSDNPADPGPLMRLCDPGENISDGFRRRLVETLGVVVTSTPSVDCKLVIEEKKAPPLPESVKQALRLVRGEVEGQSGPQRPDGEELVDSLSMNRIAMQVACGFYYKWIYPKCEFPRDTKLVLSWLEARKEWFCEVREKLKRSEEHLDSPLLVQHAAERAHNDRPTHKGLPVWKSTNWPRWRDTRNTVHYETETVWLDDFLVNDVVEWARENRGIVWYDHGAFGQRVSELSGLPMFGAGKDAKALLLGDSNRGIKGEDGSRSVVCSAKAHGTGTNGLQHRFSDALIVTLPSGDGVEQVISRLHRPGQKADTVRYSFFKHTKEISAHVDNVLRAAIYVENTLGSRQKITLGFEVC